MKENNNENKDMVVYEETVNKEKEGVKKYKKHIKKFIIIGGVTAALVGTAALGILYSTVKGNMNYNQADLEKVALEKVSKEENYNQDKSKEIALEKVQGEVVSVDKDLDDDNMSVTYEFKIKGKDNMLYEVEVDSNTGAIVDYDSPNSDTDNHRN